MSVKGFNDSLQDRMLDVKLTLVLATYITWFRKTGLEGDRSGKLRLVGFGIVGRYFVFGRYFDCGKGK